MSRRRPLALLVLVLPVVLTAGLGVAAGYAVSRAIRIPRVSELATYRPDIVTEIRGADGSVIARYAIERRVLIGRRQIPDVMVKALLAAEDARFFEHGGIDVVRVGGAILKDLASRRLAQGASTLTQQLARSVFLSPEKSFARKLNEAFLTVEIEKSFSKDQILTMYLNQIYFGHGNYGVAAASTWFFGHPVGELTLPEAALLAGMIQRPEHYSPLRNPAETKKRRDFVLRRMHDERFIDAETRDRAIAQPIELSRSAHESTVGPYFCEEVRQYLERAYGDRGLYRQGLRVDSTLDPKLERIAEEALRWGLRKHERRFSFRDPRNLVREGIDPEKYRDPSWSDSEAFPEVMTAVVLSASKSAAEVRVGTRKMTIPASAFRWTRAESPARLLERGDLIQLETLETPDGKTETIVAQEPVVQGAVVVLENGTGAIRALVGGYDFARSKFDRATQSLRQVGSAFKPFVYLTAVEQGFTPADTVLDSPVSIVVDPKKPAYQPQNYYKKYNGIVTYQYALEQSVNVPAVRVSLLVGLKKVVETAHRLGIDAGESPRPRQKLLAYPSLALGSFEASPVEMAAAYSAIASQGLLFTPRMVERVRDSEGVTLEESSPEPKEAVSPTSAYVLLNMMRGVTARGTAAAAQKLGLAMGGKTGTTNDYTDAWFIGFTPKHTMAVWVGHDTKRTLGPKSTGGDTALPIWMRIAEKMKEAGYVSPTDDFDVPQGIVFVPIDLATGYRATPSCSRVVLEAFVNGTQPTELCGDQPHAVATMPQYLQKAVYAPKRGEQTGESVVVTDAPRLAPPPEKSSPEGGPPG